MSKRMTTTTQMKVGDHSTKRRKLKMKREPYLSPELEVLNFDSEDDVITTSDSDVFDDDIFDEI